MGLNQLTIKEAREKLEAGEITSVELAKACLDRIKEVDDKIHACLAVCEEEALKEAEAADKRIAKGEKGDLLGIPYIAKDNIMTKGVKTTAASKILEDYIAPYDATVVARLRKAGAVLLGKSNLDEFAHGASTENSAFGPTKNPWDTERVPGGSSGGSAAAVAANMCIFALGTDTGGSIRHPASFCGVTGYKPTYGRSSRFGLIAMTSSTDVPGPITKTAEDASAVLDVISGVDKHDSTTKDEPGGMEKLDYGKSKLKIGLPREFYDNLSPELKKIMDDAVSVFKENGAGIKEVSLPHTKYAVPVYYIITPSEISSNLARFDGIRYGFSADVENANKVDAVRISGLEEVYMKSRGEGFGPEVKRRIMLGTYALSAGYFDAYYLQAQKVRTKISRELDSVLEEFDCLLTPTAPHVAFKAGEKSDPHNMYLEDIFVTSFSLAGLPAVSIPGGFLDGLPIGIQLASARFKDNKTLAAARKFQSLTDFHKKFPNL